jgi:type II secretory pathway pseudopilin PulG
MRISLRSSRRDANVGAAEHTTSRKGFMLVEVIVAMVLLAIAVTSLAGLVYSVSQSGIKTSGDAYRNGVLMHEVNRLEGLPYDLIPTGTSSYSVSTGSYPHTRVVTVAEPVTNVKTIRIVITPVNSKFKPDSVAFLRTKARTSRALCTSCQ